MSSKWGIVGLVCALGLAACGANATGDAGDEGGDGGDGDAPPECASDEMCTSIEAPECSAAGTCGGCTGAAACMRFPDTPLCLAATGACVSCRDNLDCADAAAPTCDAETHTCRACSLDSDCESGVCDVEEGTCVDAASIYLVDDDQACATGDGSAAAPFCDIAEALAAFTLAPRNFVAVRPGSYVFPALTTAPLPFFVSVAQDAAVIGPAAAGEDCLAASASTALAVRGFAFVGCDIAVRVDAAVPQARLQRLKLEGAQVGVSCRGDKCVLADLRVESGGTGVLCAGGAICDVKGLGVSGAQIGLAAQGAQLIADGVEIAGAVIFGMSLEDSEVDVRRATVTGTAAAPGAAPGIGVGCGKGYCAFERLVVSGTRGPGLFIVQSSYEVRASAILDNGTTDGMAAAPSGGVVISSPGATRIFDGNTVAGNRAPAGAVAGVRCGAAALVKGSIVWGNDGAALDAACSATYSDVQGGAPGEGNIDADPMLISMTSGAMDAHLADGSPCVDTGDPAGGTMVDLDGEARPRGARVDMGADER